jgi:hypothetical protein
MGTGSGSGPGSGKAGEEDLRADGLLAAKGRDPSWVREYEHRSGEPALPVGIRGSRDLLTPVCPHRTAQQGLGGLS